MGKVKSGKLIFWYKNQSFESQCGKIGGFSTFLKDFVKIFLTSVFSNLSLFDNNVLENV